MGRPPGGRRRPRHRRRRARPREGVLRRWHPREGGRRRDHVPGNPASAGGRADLRRGAMATIEPRPICRRVTLPEHAARQMRQRRQGQPVHAYSPVLAYDAESSPRSRKDGRPAPRPGGSRCRSDASPRAWSSPRESMRSLTLRATPESCSTFYGTLWSAGSPELALTETHSGPTGTFRWGRCDSGLPDVLGRVLGYPSDSVAPPSITWAYTSSYSSGSIVSLPCST